MFDEWSTPKLQPLHSSKLQLLSSWTKKLANKILKSSHTRAREELNKINNENLNGLQGLILKFHNCTLDYFDLHEEMFDGRVIFNCLMCILYHNRMKWKMSLFLQNLYLLKHFWIQLLCKSNTIIKLICNSKKFLNCIALIIFGNLFYSFLLFSFTPKIVPVCMISYIVTIIRTVSPCRNECKAQGLKFLGDQAS